MSIEPKTRKTSQQRIEEIRKANGGKAYGHGESAVQHCAELLDAVDGSIDRSDLLVLAELVKEMRDAQKRYFRTRRQSDGQKNLIRSKVIEALVDVEVFNILNPPQPIQQGDLFNA